MKQAGDMAQNLEKLSPMAGMSYYGEIPKARVERVEPVLSDVEKPGAVRCKLGAHTPLIYPGGMVMCAFCWECISLNAADEWAQVQMDLQIQAQKRIDDLIPTAAEMEKQGVRNFNPLDIRAQVEMSGYEWAKGKAVDTGRAWEATMNKAQTQPVIGGSYQSSMGKGKASSSA